MSKTIIEVKCNDQVLTLTNTPVIASGGVGEDYVSFEFCEKWDGFAVSAVFWRKGVDCIPVLLDAENTCQVPPELMTSEGIVYFGAVGIAPDGTTRTSEPISYLIREGTITENTVLPMPGEDVYQQLMSYYADVKLYVSTRIDEAADAALAAGANAQAAQEAAENAEKLAEDAVDAVEDVIYPGIVQADLDDGANSIGVTLDCCPPDKMFLTFKAPALHNTAYDEFNLATLRVRYPAADGTQAREAFWIRDGFNSKSPDNAIRPFDIVTVLLSRVDGKAVAYILNPRITNTVLGEMNRRIYPGIPSSKTTAGTMTLALNYEPVDKFFMVFAADCNSSDVTRFVLDYESYEEGPVQVEYALCDGYNSPVSVYGFYQGDHVVVVLDPASKRATVLNPRLTQNTLNVMQGLIDEINTLRASIQSSFEIIEYTGSGSASLTLNFDSTPKVIQIESTTSPSYRVSAILFKESACAKIRWFVDGSSDESFIELGELGSDYIWMDGTKFVQLVFGSNGIPSTYFNRKGEKYVAIGMM